MFYANFPEPLLNSSKFHNAPVEWLHDSPSYSLTKHLRLTLRHSAAWGLEGTQYDQPAMDTMSETGAQRLGAAWWTTDSLRLEVQSLTVHLASALVGPDVQDS